jgi:hypothetical protein
MEFEPVLSSASLLVNWLFILSPKNPLATIRSGWEVTMLGRRAWRLAWAPWLVGLLSGCGEQPPAPPALAPAKGAPAAGRADTAEQGPVVARVGDRPLHLGEVDALAAAAQALRSRPPWNLPEAPAATLEQRVALAVELLAMVRVAEQGRLGPARIEDARERALAAAWLQRFVAGAPDEQPIDEDALRRAHQEVIAEYLSTGESTIYEPTRVEVHVVGVGLFPDWTAFEDETIEPVVERSAAVALAERIRAACGDVVADGDALAALVRRFQPSNPTVRIEHRRQVAFSGRLFSLPAAFRRPLRELDRPGRISPVIETPGGAFLLRRGLLQPGRGEQLDDVRAELTERVRNQRRGRRLEEALEALRRRIGVHVYADRFRQAFLARKNR